MKLALSLTLAIVLLSPAGGSFGAVPSLVGAYTCSGSQGGAAYTIPLEIEALGQAYSFTWLTDGKPTLLGLGIVHEGWIAVAIVDPRSGAVGVVLYAVRPGRWLEGVWTRGDGTIDTENCSVGGRPKSA